MTNNEISAVLYEIAELLELTDVSRFEVIAYQNAARQIEYLEENIEGVYKEGGTKALDALPGIGMGIAKNIAELIETGKLEKKVYLLKKIPKVQLEINAIPSVGPKTTLKLYKVLKPKNMPDFISKLKNPKNADKLAAISLKEKTIKNILRGIDIREKMSVRVPIGIALPVAEYFLSALKDVPGITNADAVGSLRRMRDTVGDIDIIACGKEASNAIALFTHLPEVKQVLAEGPISARVIHQSGIQVDLKILPKAQYGSLLQHFTGSKEHNVALRTWAVPRGFSISEHGIKKTQKSKTTLIKCDTEEKLYQNLGMDWIPPELRENQGEIEAALKHSIPKLITMGDIKGDLQIHTTASDGKTNIQAMVDQAKQQGYEYIAITDHSVGIGITGGLDKKGLINQRKEIDQINNKLKREKSKLLVLQGSEVNIRADGELDLPDDALKLLDIVVASIHSSFSQSAEETTKRYLKAINNPNVDVIAHPTGRLLGKRDVLNVLWQEIFASCLKTQTALEINAAPDRLDLPPKLAKEAALKGVKLIISTDSHSPEGLQNMRFGVAQARRAWLTKDKILNTLDKDRFINWLER